MHHRSPTRGLDAGTRGPGNHEQAHEILERPRVRRSREGERATPQAESENGALTEAIGGDSPWEKRQSPADPGRRQQQPDLPDREPVLVLQCRRDDRQPDAEDRRPRLRGSPRGEHRPPVARACYSPKGLIGRAPVETMTLFVSR